MDIETPRLMLIETYSVVDEHVKWLNDKQHMRFSEQKFREHDYASQHAFLGKASEDGNPLVYDIRTKVDPMAGPLTSNLLGLGQSVGSLHVYMDRRHSRCDLGILIGPEHARKGFGLEAWGAVQDFLFIKLNFKKLEAGCVGDNVAMRSILVKSGWELEGIRKSHFFYDGYRRDLVMYGKLGRYL